MHVVLFLFLFSGSHSLARGVFQVAGPERLFYYSFLDGMQYMNYFFSQLLKEVADYLSICTRREEAGSVAENGFQASCQNPNFFEKENVTIWGLCYFPPHTPHLKQVLFSLRGKERKQRSHGYGAWPREE